MSIRKREKVRTFGPVSIVNVIYNNNTNTVVLIYNNSTVSPSIPVGYSFNLANCLVNEDDFAEFNKNSKDVILKYEKLSTPNCGIIYIKKA